MPPANLEYARPFPSGHHRPGSRVLGFIRKIYPSSPSALAFEPPIALQDSPDRALLFYGGGVRVLLHL